MLHDKETELLRQQGHRLTPQRLEILQVVKVHGCHITAEEIHAAIVPRQPYLSVATVYRTLQWLQSVGLVAVVSIDGRLCYEYRVVGQSHHHLVCLRCGQHLQVPDEAFATFRSDLQRRYRFTIQTDHLALPGLCKECAALEATTKAVSYPGTS